MRLGSRRSVTRYDLAMIRPTSLLPLLLVFACASGAKDTKLSPTQELTARTPQAHVEHWGAMKAVLRDGLTQGRVSLDEALGPNTFAVGALEGLAAEITVVDGVIHLAEVIESGTGIAMRVRAPVEGEQATLLVTAQVDSWVEHLLPRVANLKELETAVRDIALAEGIDVTLPFPFKVEGDSSQIHLHVLNHSCPIANPDGPSPWTFEGVNESVVLVGFYASDAGGVLTHHGQNSHVHAVVATQNVSGHLDSISLTENARLFLPGRSDTEPGPRTAHHSRSGSNPDHSIPASWAVSPFQEARSSLVNLSR